MGIIKNIKKEIKKEIAREVAFHTTLNIYEKVDQFGNKINDFSNSEMIQKIDSKVEHIINKATPVVQNTVEVITPIANKTVKPLGEKIGTKIDETIDKVKTELSEEDLIFKIKVESFLKKNPNAVLLCVDFIELQNARMTFSDAHNPERLLFYAEDRKKGNNNCRIIDCSQLHSGDLCLHGNNSINPLKRDVFDCTVAVNIDEVNIGAVKTSGKRKYEITYTPAKLHVDLLTGNIDLKDKEKDIFFYDYKNGVIGVYEGEYAFELCMIPVAIEMIQDYRGIKREQRRKQRKRQRIVKEILGPLRFLDILIR